MTATPLIPDRYVTLYGCLDGCLGYVTTSRSIVTMYQDALESGDTLWYLVDCDVCEEIHGEGIHMLAMMRNDSGEKLIYDMVEG